jgi:hypothetical protein
MNVQDLLDQAALRRTAERYAQGADRRDKAVWREILAADCVLNGPGFDLQGREAALGSLDFLAATFTATQHKVHNQTVQVTGDTASGETYCTADHLQEANGERTLSSWAIRYQDEWRREDGHWLFTRRTLVIDWIDSRPLRG